MNRALLGDRAQQQVGETTVTAVSNYEEVRVLGTLQELLGGRAFEYHSLHHGVVVLIDAGRIHLTVEQSQRFHLQVVVGEHGHRQGSRERVTPHVDGFGPAGFCDQQS